MSNFKRKSLLLACILSLQLVRPISSVHANPITLTYDGQQHIYNKPPITLHIDDQKINMPLMPPVQIDGRTLVPTREVFEPMGAAVEWKTAEKKVFINHGDTLMILEVDNQDVWIDGKMNQLDVPPKIINDKLMLPLRFIGETLGYQVDWDHQTSNININQHKPSAPDPKPTNPNTNIKPQKQLVDVSYITVDNIDHTQSLYKIHFKDSIDSYVDFQEKGKVVIDINNAKNLLGSKITLSDNPYVHTVRTSQYTADKTRVVFDLKAGANAHVQLANDGRSIIVKMEPTMINNIVTGNNGVGGFMILPGMAQSQLNISTLQNPDRLMIDIPMSSISDKVDLSNILGECVSDTHISQESGRTRIVLTLHGAAPYEVTDQNQEVRIQLTKPIKRSTRNIKYTSTPQEIFAFKKAPGLTINDIKINDDYRNRRITITLPQNNSDLFDDGLMHIGSRAIDKITVQSRNQTQFIIHEKLIQAVKLIDDGENIQVVLMPPRDKYDKIVVLDLGHGAQDSGARANGLVEKTLNLQQGMAAYELLEKDPYIKVYMTRVDDSYPTNPDRAKLANEIGADLFISMHNNSFTPKANGTEVLYSTSNGKSKQMAQIMQKNMVNQLGTFNRGVKPRPDLIVLNSTKMPAILTETAFMSNPEDAQKLKSPEFNKKVGRVVYESIIEIFNTLSFR